MNLSKVEAGRFDVQNIFIIVEISFFVIIISVILTAIGMFVLKRMETTGDGGEAKEKGEEKPAAEAEKPEEEG